MKYRYKLLTIISCVLLFFGCTARIDIKTDDAKPGLAVFGYLTNDTMQHAIKITRTTGYFSTDPSPIVSSAKVSITDGEKVFVLSESFDTPGVYLTASDVYGEEGKTYTLNLELDFDNDGIDELYQAKATMPYATRVDSIVLADSKMPFLPDLLLYGKVPDNQKNYLAVYLIKNNEPKIIFDYLMILPDGYFIGHDIQGYEFPCFVNEGVGLGDTITFRVSSFSNDFSSFISHARSESGAKNPIFSGPPANVRTNITALDPTNEVVIQGYFGAFPSSEKSTISEKKYNFP